ncbi:Uncharacterised protein [Sphingobacterium thalpophilum]|uniref:Uncharacterized protein n=1 Tax=Sphingobacterium thalpophilum TaxID=259 RepID=A0A4V6KRI1_9SPHI|nr:Uncharacterised protein [Sphingobacterium thalpophilum]
MNLVFDNNTIDKANRLPNTIFYPLFTRTVLGQDSNFQPIFYCFSIIQKRILIYKLIFTIFKSADYKILC